MTRTVTVRREANRVAIDESDKDGVVSTQYMSADVAIAVARDMIRIATDIMVAERAVVTAEVRQP